MVDLHKVFVKNSSFYSRWHKNANHHVVHWLFFLAIALLVATSLIVAVNKSVQISFNSGKAGGVAIGGFLEKSTSNASRPLYTAAQLSQFLPSSRGPFVFPTPYGTQGYRITVPADCGGQDCVNYVGYSYWSNMSNAANSNLMYMFVTLDRNRGGSGPTLFSLDKLTGTVTKVGPLFASTDNRSWATGEGWYFSSTQPTKLYMIGASSLNRFDVITKASTTVFDISSAQNIFGSNRGIWQTNSSSNDLVHSFTVKDNANYTDLGCGVYLESTAQYKYYPTVGQGFDECQIDRSGRYLMIKEQVDNRNGEDNRIIDLQANTEARLLDENGAMGHSDTGQSYVVGEDNWLSTGPGFRLWQLGANPPGPGTIVYRSADWNHGAPSHVSFLNSSASTPISQQYSCGSGAESPARPGHGNEVVCFKLDGSLDTLVVAPVMTDLNASGGGDSYSQAPKGNLDPTGQYFMWTSNMAGNRLDAFVVRVPSQLLVGGVTPPPPPAVLPPPPAPQPNPPPPPTVNPPPPPPVVNPPPPPVQQPVSISINSTNVTTTRNSATIGWTTNAPSLGTVVLSDGKVLVDSVYSLNHSLTFTNLNKNTSYNYTLTATSSSSTQVTKSGRLKTKNR